MKTPPPTNPHGRSGLLPILALLLAIVIPAMIDSIRAQTTLTAKWNPNPEPDIAGYKVHLGTSSGSYTVVVDVVDGTSVVLTGLAPSTTYYCAVQAYNTSGLMSEMSDEVSGTTAAAKEPDIEVRVAENRTLSAGKDQVRFVNSPRTKTFTLTNRGNADLAGLTVQLSGPNTKDFIRTRPDTTSLAPGESTTFKVTFKPRIFARRRLAAIRITSNDPDTGVFEITLLGRDTAALERPKPVRKAIALPSNIRESGNRPLKSTMVVGGQRFRCISILKIHGRQIDSRSVEVSGNLVDWSSGPAHTTVVTDNAARLKVRDNTPLKSGSKRHIRLRKTLKRQQERSY